MSFSVRGGRKRTAGAALAAVLLAGGAVSCGSEKSDKAGADMAPAAAVKKAAAKTEDLTSFTFRMKGSVPGDGRVQADAAMSTKPLAMRMKMSAPDQGPDKVEMRFVGGALYLGGGAAAAKEMDGKSWIKFDAKSLGEKGGKSPASSLSGQADNNPADQSTLLTGSKDLKKVGSESVGGVETTRYTGTVSLDQLHKLAKDGDAATQKRREKSIKQYEDMGIKKLTMDLWVDGEDHTKQFRARGKADKGALDMTVTFLDYNKPVHVEAPPKKLVMDLGEEMKGLQG
ncbi:LppX_LprAFG lipoprotein [Streptomyces kanamyceticus]|uniref:LppX_LprAFG lipoprotein n=1 Tax=Streptomyces kanamyceticus TaxID=1967 RepID=A0A5J6GH27_STRKN|nr:LppX_LprAFG lipoprotein [Streptomyces kanamyceticus]QEU92456.1 LppX_LprAFG lipoprotein [Streptomyces kanamyceticus]